MPKKKTLNIVADFRVHLKKPLKTRHEFIEKVNVMQAGEFRLVINGASIPVMFRWSLDSYRVGENVAILCINSYGPFKWWMYRQTYKKLGLKKKDVTAELLASAEAVECFNIHLELDADWDNEIVSVEPSFVELTDGERYYRLPEQVIEEYKAKINKLSSNNNSL